MSNDLLWLILSYVAVGLIIAVATWAGQGGGRSPEITRKIVHIGVGTWIIPTTLFFESPWMAIIPPASFVLINLLSYRYKLVQAMEQGDRNPGTIYFPLAFVILILVSWPGGIWVDHAAGMPDRAARLPALAGILVLAWGDAAAAIVGRAVGRHRYRAFGATRSWEGSLAFVVFGTLAIVVSRLILPDDAVQGGASLMPLIPSSILRVLPAALLEAVTPFGLDNLVVPMAVALMMFHFG